MTTKSEIWHKKQELISQRAANVREEVSDTPLFRAMDLESVSGSLSWLTTLPIEEHGFCLHKGAFVDVLVLLHGWANLNIASNCVWGVPFEVNHLLSCSHFRFSIIVSQRNKRSDCQVVDGCVQRCPKWARPAGNYYRDHDQTYSKDSRGSKIRQCNQWFLAWPVHMVGQVGHLPHHFLKKNRCESL